MLICDICDDEIKRVPEVYVIPSEYEIEGVTEICKKCDRKIRFGVDKINRDLTKVRRDNIKAMVQALKDSGGA